MDFKDSIKQISERIENLKANLPTEEATKTALIMPFINALGYDIFNPLEVLPEMSCDIGTKKGEKIDYAILKDGEPIILIECKHWEQDLNLHDNQLLRYFNVTKAKFGVLTNGIIYRFYTDLAEPNIMDDKPFLEVNLLDLKDTQIEELKKFHRSYFDVDTILSSASELKYTGELKTAISKEFASPTPDFVKYFGKQVYDGVFTPKVLEQFTSLVKRSINNYINENNEKMRLLVEKTKQQYEKVKEAARECELYAKVVGKDDILSKMSIDKLEKEQKEIESYKDSMLFYKERDSLLWLRIDNRKYAKPVYLYKAYVKAVLKYNDGRTQNLADTLHPVMNSEYKVYDWRNK